MNERYPLIDHAAERLRAASDRPLAEITLDAAADGALSIEDLQIHADTLRAQAEIARATGYCQLAANLTRAAELARVPNDEVLHVYELLRPGRASFAELIALAELLERRYDARETAGLVREAASVYQSRGLARR